MKLLSFIAMATLSTATAYAQDFEPAPYELTDGFAVMPKLSVDLHYDDNIFNTESDEIDSLILLLKPYLKFGTNDGINQYGGFYELTSATYSYGSDGKFNGSDDNYIDHRFALLAHTEYSSKHRTDFKLGFENLHEDRGSGLTESNSTFFDAPLKYNNLSARGYYQYGGLTALMRIGAGIEYVNKTYKNFTEQTKYSDVDGLKFFADADYQFGSVTFVTFDLSTTDKQYAHLKTGSDSKDNLDTVAFVGLKWEGLNKTTGTAKIGYQYKTFDSSNRESFTGFNADLGLIWEPVNYSSFTAHATRNAEDSDTVGDYIEKLGASISWNHNWTERFYSTLEYKYRNDNFIGASREDDINNAGLYLNYNFTRWFKVNAGYEYTNKDSNADNISYDKNSFNLGAVVAL